MLIFLDFFHSDLHFALDQCWSFLISFIASQREFPYLLHTHHLDQHQAPGALLRILKYAAPSFFFFLFFVMWLIFSCTWTPRPPRSPPRPARCSWGPFSCFLLLLLPSSSADSSSLSQSSGSGLVYTLRDQIPDVTEFIMTDSRFLLHSADII